MAKVLIVDDAAFMRMALKMALEKSGFEIAGEAENGAIGVEKYKELSPDLVTMDITMPTMSGVDALKAIRAYDSKAKIVMVTAMGQEPIIREAIESGASSFIIKPFNEEHIIKTFNQVLST